MKGGRGSGSIDPSTLHLRKELIQIQKARVLKDPGAIDSARTLTKRHCLHRHKNGPIDGNAVVFLPDQFVESPLKLQGNSSYDCVSTKGEKDGVKEKERKVFLYNWRSENFESEVSRLIGEDDAESSKGEGSFSTRDDDGSLIERHQSGVFRCKDADFTPSIWHIKKKKSKRANYSRPGLWHSDEKLHGEMIMSRFQKNTVEASPGYGIGRDDASDDHLVLTRAALVSPLFSELESSCSKHRTWDATPGSMKNADNEVKNPGQSRCGIPCYWSRRSSPKSQLQYGVCCSPSVSDTLRGKGSQIFHRSPSLHRRRRRRRQSIDRQLNYKISSPVLTNRSLNGGRDSDEDLSTNFDMEACSRLDRRRWSTNGKEHKDNSPESVRGISHKYRPMFFYELIGQSMVVQSLSSAASRRRIAPIYLFQGPHGTGKTSMARIFAAALNCLSIEKSNKPCGICQECVDFASGKNEHLIELDGSNKKEIDRIKNLVKGLLTGYPSSVLHFKVLVVNECHLLSLKTWLTFLPLLEKPMANAVIVLTTTDVKNVPHRVLSLCQKHIFSKINSEDIVSRLSKIAIAENLDIEPDALDLIAINSDGSMQEAETVLDQLSLLGRRIDISLVNRLVGVVSDAKLLDLLELAMSSNATETVRRARELLQSGVDPIILTSQMAALIVDIIANAYSSVDQKHGSFFSGRCLSERELNQLKRALALLSEAEKHLRTSSERSTWFTATLLQLGYVATPDRPHSASPISAPRSMHRDFTSKANSISWPNDAHRETMPVSQTDGAVGGTALKCSDLNTLNKIWLQCVEKCHAKTLRELLHVHGKLVSISEAKGGIVAQIAFGDKTIKARAEGFLSSITNSFEIVLRHNVEIQIVQLSESLDQLQVDENKSTTSSTAVDDKDHQARVFESSESSNPEKRIKCLIHQQGLETAWMQALSKPKRNHQVVPQDRTYRSNKLQLVNSMDDAWEDELNHELKALKLHDGTLSQNDGIGKRIARCSPLSQSLLHSSNTSFASDFSKNNAGYESGSGAPCCSGMLCWNNTKPNRRQEKAKQGTPICRRKGSIFCVLRGQNQ